MPLRDPLSNIGMGWGAGAGQGVSRWGTSGAVVLTLQFIGLQKLAKVCHPSF